MTRRIKRNPDKDLMPLARNYASNRALRERAEKAEGEFKKELMEILAAQGEEQEGGHKIILLPEGVPLGRKTMVGIQRQRRAPTTLSEERAEEYLKSKKLWEACTTQITVLNEEAMLALNFTGRIPDTELQALYDVKETFAFYPVYED
jgi:hypothetical protein